MTGIVEGKMRCNLRDPHIGIADQIHGIADFGIDDVLMQGHAGSPADHGIQIIGMIPQFSGHHTAVDLLTAIALSAASRLPERA